MIEPAAFKFAGTDAVEGTRYAASPWNSDACHGGATAALLAHIAENLRSRTPMEVARLTIDLLKAVPCGSPLMIRSAILREGRRTQLARIELQHEDATVAQAMVLKVERSELSDALRAGSAPEVVLPNVAASSYPLPPGFADLMTIVRVDGGFGHGGHGRMWFRVEHEVIEGIPLSPLQRAVAAADFGGGLSFPRDASAWSFPSVDLTISLHRRPIGLWTLVDARSSMSNDRVSICAADLQDERGRFGSSLQTVLTSPC